MIDELINKMDEDAPANAVAHGGVCATQLNVGGLSFLLPT